MKFGDICDLTRHEIDTKKEFKFIDKIGLELEGGWETRPEEYKIHSDGSVRTNASIKGEVRTTPQNTLNKVFKEINTKYPEDIDESCGMHIHISIKDGLLFMLTGVEFRDYFLFRMGNLAKYLRKAGNKLDYDRFLYRFGDKNMYCRRDFIPKDQLKSCGARRTMLNFTSYHKHGTLECRLMPMFEKVSSARLATKELVDTIETYLAYKSKDISNMEINVDIEDSIDIPEEHQLEAICA